MGGGGSKRQQQHHRRGAVSLSVSRLFWCLCFLVMAAIAKLVQMNVLFMRQLPLMMLSPSALMAYNDTASSSVLPFETTTIPTPTSTKAITTSNLAIKLPSSTLHHHYHNSSVKIVRRKDEDATAAAAAGEKALGLLYPPGILGGYANQVIRFVSLVHYAHRRKIPNLFLPSLWWTTQVPTPPSASSYTTNDTKFNATTTTTTTTLFPLQSYPIPMDLVFDVELWNEMASQQNSQLPKIVNRLNNPTPAQCWQTLAKTNQSLAFLDDQTTKDEISLTTTTSNAAAIVRHLNAKTKQSASSAAAWPIESMLERYGYMPALLNETVEMMTSTMANPRRMDFLDRATKHCSDNKNNYNSNNNNNYNKNRASWLVFYGGGKAGGRLWNEAMKRQQQGKTTITATTTKQNLLQTSLDSQVRMALQPAPQWKRVAELCLETRMLSTTTTTSSHGYGSSHSDRAHNHGNNYVALHARIELEMMDHRCGKTMEQSLKRILDQVRQFLSTSLVTSSSSSNGNNSNTTMRPPLGLLLVMSRAGIEGKGFSENMVRRHATQAANNAKTLAYYVNEQGYATAQRLVLNHSSLGGGNYSFSVPVFECGSFALEEHFYKMRRKTAGGETNNHKNNNFLISNYGTLVESVINFYNAVNARIFIGVKGSSYSTDIWTTRYLYGKGSSNYYYNKGGAIEPVENGGLPDPHVNCK
ncbi:hypothetical protein ACA910_018139 [Epithemia clementina (nom. ined.)]